MDYIRRNWQGLLISILIAELTGALSSLLSGTMKTDYIEYIKPPLSPPVWIFGVVWVLLYALMGIAAYLIYTSNIPQHIRLNAIKLYAIQLFVNFLWSIVFFRFQMPWLAFIVILLLDFLVILTIKAFKDINKTAALLLIPYLVWILFATYLNLGIAILN